MFVLPRLTAWLFTIAACFAPLLAQAQTVSPEVFTRAEAGDLSAQITLSGCYSRGMFGVPKNLSLSAKWLGKAAEQGHAESQYQFGHLHLGPHAWPGVPIDPSVAAEWYLKAAEQGHKWAQLSLGDAYAHGSGVVKDDTQAAQWYLKAASKGVEQAQYAVGRAYVAGRGLPKDPAEAVAWYRLAADRGHVLAQLDLADMLQKGEGVPKDEVEACAWLSIVAAENPAHRPKFQRCYGGLSPDSRKLVQARADILRKEIAARSSSTER